MLIWPVQRFVMSGTWRSEALREFFLFLALQERRRVPLVESLDRLRARRSKKTFLCLLKWSILFGLAGLACLGLSIVFLALCRTSLGEALLPGFYFISSPDTIKKLTFCFFPCLAILSLGVLTSCFLDVILSPEDYCQELAARLYPAVSHGQPLSEAMRLARGWFPVLAADLVAAGEETGQLAESLDDLAAYLKSDQTTPFSEWTLVLYPFPTVVVALFLLAFLMAFVMPKTVAIFSETGIPLPAWTAWVLNHVQAGFWGILGVAFVCLAAMAYGNCRFVERRGLSALIARLPLLRQWVRPLVLSQFLLVLGRFLRVRAPMPEALKRAGGMGQGSILHDLGQRAARGVQQGLSLSQALEGEALMPEGLCQMIRLAENNETLPQRCLDLAQNLRERWFFRAQRLVRIVEPLALLGVGLLVAAIAAAFYLPLFNLSVAMTQKMFE